MSEKKKVGILTMLSIAGGFISYTVGSGFASGNEVLQFFGSWGIPTCFAAIAGAVFITLLSTVCLYIIGTKKSFEKTSDAYLYVGGKVLGRFFQLFTFVSLFGTFMIMFSGAGSLLHQQWGFPQWVGSVLMGIVAAVVVVGGLDTVEKVLGSAGIIILVYVLVFGAISLFYPTSDISQADAVPQAVEEGIVYQANLMALPPLSYVIGLQKYNSPWLEGMLYAALCLVNGVPFYLAQGRRLNNVKEAGISGLMSTVLFYGCAGFVLILILFNFADVVDLESGKMQPFPALAAIHKIWPAGSWTYVLIIFIGIFTTTTGFLWVLQEWLFPGQIRTRKTNTFVVIMVIFGICLGSVLPFSVLINFIFPISGIVGLIITVCLVIRTIQLSKI